MAESYNNGLVLDSVGRVRDQQEWLYGVPARVFAALKASGATDQDSAYLYGHSAGGQFAHRLLATQPTYPFCAVIAANPGWYTLPDMERSFPEGMGELVCPMNNSRAGLPIQCTYLLAIRISLKTIRTFRLSPKH